MERIGKVLKTLLKLVLWISGIWLALLLILQAVFSSPILTKTVNRYASEYIEGDISFGKASISMFRFFPSITLTLEDFSVTYPAERYDRQEKLGVQGHLMYHGCGETADTLASFNRFTVGINVPALLGGTIRIPYLRMDSPRIFAHSYADGSANWNIFRTTSADAEAESDKVNEETPADTLSPDQKTGTPGKPKISLGRIRFTNHPHIVYTDSRDTVFTMIDVSRIRLDGRITNGKASRNRLGLELDSMFVAGRIAKDTVAVALERLYVTEDNRSMNFDAKAKALAATRSFGRLRIPVSLNGNLSFLKDTVPAVRITDLNAEIASVPVMGNADLRFNDGVVGIDAKVDINGCSIDHILKEFIVNFLPEVSKIGTDARLHLHGECSGEYGNGRIPSFKVGLSIPESRISSTEIPDEALALKLNASAETDRRGRINLSIDEMTAAMSGLDMAVTGKAYDILCDDPTLEIDGFLKGCLDSLVRFVPDSSGISAGGALHAEIKGSARLSQLDIYKFSHADLTGTLKGDSIVFRSPTDTIDIRIDGADFRLGPETRTSRRDSTRTFRLIGVSGSMSLADVNYKDQLILHTEKLSVSAKNSVDEEKEQDTTKITPFRGAIKADILTVKDGAGTSISLNETNNVFRMFPKRDNPQIPKLALRSSNNRLTLNAGYNRIILTDASIKANAAMNTVERRERRKAFLDSLARIYPDIPRDSLFRHHRAQRQSKPVPEWMKDEDFRKRDLDLRLENTLAKYFREWDLDGNINVRTGIAMTPYLPLKNILRGLEVDFNNNEIKIDSLKVKAGQSEIEAEGALTGLKRALLGRGTLKLDLDIMSDRVNANQLISAYNAGKAFDPGSISGKVGQASNDEFLEMVTADTLNADSDFSLFVIPSNINAEISVDASDIRYSGLNISKATARLIMKERCVQITDTHAESNMGDIHFDGFYATRSKEDLKTGFSINFKDITAEKVISLMPAIDTLMPMLKSFKGQLNCEMAATSDIDTNMNLVLPSIDGILRISGDNLTMNDNEMFRTLAKKLMFKNKEQAKIEHMIVEGIIKNSIVEVFPFVTKIDRYTMAMSGVQNLDMSFRYHISVLKSPFLVRLGIDLHGDDFDNMKFKIGKAKYKSTNVPVFSAIIDHSRINLVKSIKGIFDIGVENTLNKGGFLSGIFDHKRSIGYVQAVDQKLEALSESEQKQLEDEAAAEEVSAQDDVDSVSEASHETTGEERNE